MEPFQTMTEKAGLILVEGTIHELKPLQLHFVRRSIVRSLDGSITLSVIKHPFIYSLPQWG